jgi:hypothetical protein
MAASAAPPDASAEAQIVPLAETLYEQAFDPQQPFSPLGAIGDQLATGMLMMKQAKEIAASRGAPDDPAFMIIVARKKENKQRAIDVMQACADLANNSRAHMGEMLEALKRDVSGENANALLRALLQAISVLSDIVVRENATNLESARALQTEMAKVAPEFEELEHFLAKTVLAQEAAAPQTAHSESGRLGAAKHLITSIDE